MTPKTNTTFLSDTKIKILAILDRQNLNNFVSGGIYLRPHVLLIPKMKSWRFCILRRPGGEVMQKNPHQMAPLISWPPTNWWTQSNIHFTVAKLVNSVLPWVLFDSCFRKKKIQLVLFQEYVEEKLNYPREWNRTNWIFSS